MKIKVSTLFVILLGLVSIAMLAFAPMPAPAAQANLPPDVLSVILKIALGFASLVGVSKLVVVLVQVLKAIGLAKDDTADKWAAGINLTAFLALVYFGVFQPGLTFDILDGYAAQIAQIALFVLGMVMQIMDAKPTYEAFKASRLPLLSYSHTTT